MSAHLDDNQAAAFVAGELPARAVSGVERHLASCKDCRRLLAALAGSSDHDSDVDTRRIARASQAGALPPRPALRAGDRVGRYQLFGALGAGGMGVVWSAYDPQLDRKVALKVLHPGASLGVEEARARLTREAQAIAQLSHPNVVGVYDVGPLDDRLGGGVYVAMELIEGETLTSWLHRWKPSWREIVERFVQAGRGLAAAHAVGLLHRDFKPDNVLVGADGRVRVGDFGLARSQLGDDEVVPMHITASALAGTLTATGTVLGTPRYMAPEQLTGGAIDARSDQFGFAVALYEALFGQHPFVGQTAAAMVEHGERARDPVQAAAPPYVVAAVMRGLEPQVSKRHPSMNAMLGELAPVVESRARWGPLAVAAVLVVGVAGAAVWQARQRLPAADADDRINALLVRIDQLEHEREVYTNQLKVLLRRTDVDHGELERLARELEAKDAEIQTLRQQLTDPRVASNPTRRPPRVTAVGDGGPRNPVGTKTPTMAALKAAVATATPDVQGCLDEWRERHPARNIDVDVDITISADGTTYGADVRGGEGVSMPICVRDAISRVVFPTSEVEVDLDVWVSWSDGLLAMTPTLESVRATGSTAPTGLLPSLAPSFAPRRAPPAAAAVAP